MKRNLIIVSLLMLTTMLFADGRSTSLNTEVKVVPAPGEVVIDGQTGDWDLSAGIWSYNAPTLVDQYSVWTHLMWDSKGIYFLARYNDETPMSNAAASKDFSKSWRADCFQGRVIFDDRTDAEHQMHINMYYATPDQRALMIVHHGGFKAKPPYDATGPQRNDQLEKWGATMEKAGGMIAIKPWDNNKGYNVEAFWPWSYCRTSGKALKPGENFTFGLEAMWGNREGTKNAHRLADGIKDDTVNRIFMFRARNGWGKATISATGNLDISKEQRKLQTIRLKKFQNFDTYGSVDIKYDLPETRDVTIAIDNENGQRVRNLFGQYSREAGKNMDKWDCLDDAGNPVKPGTYTATVLHHKPIELELANSCYSSAIPPWPTDKGTKFWGSNHGFPTSVATKGKETILLFTGTEGGSGIQKINDQGVIQWADSNEFIDATIGNKYVYALSKNSWQKKTLLFRFRLNDGFLTPFNDKERTPSPALLPDEDVEVVSSIAMAYGSLWAFFPHRALLQVNPDTGAVIKEYKTADILALTDRDGKLFALDADGSVNLLDKNLKARKLFAVKGLINPVRLGISQDQNFFAISDKGTNQVVVVDKAGKVHGKVGSSWKGADRPAGKFIKTDLVQPMGADFDHLGRLWITEGRKSCKRVTCWSKDYELIDQYWGQADYGAMAGFPLTYDATRFIAHGIEFKLDQDPKPTVRKTNEQPLIYHPELAHNRGLVYEYNGHEYACGVPGYNKCKALVIYKRNSQGVFAEVVKIELAGRRKKDGKWVRTKGYTWVDLNDNGKKDADEIQADTNISGSYWSCGWVRPDMTIITVKGQRFNPLRFTKGGVPVYDFTKPEIVKNWIEIKRSPNSNGTPVMDMAGNVSNGIVYHTLDGRMGSYPNPYGRHDAPAAEPGLLIAPFRTNGVVENVPGVGSMTALGGDRGEWYLMSMDGLFISSICQDIKGKVTLDETFIGAESFGGFFWRDTVSKQIMVQLGGASYRTMKVKNLESCVKVKVKLDVTKDDIVKGLEIVRKSQQEVVPEPDAIKIAKVRKLPANPPAVAQPSKTPLIKGAVDIKVVERGNPERWFRASLAHNNRELALAYQVADDSPWKNGSGQFTHAFIGGDCVDLQLAIPGKSPIRLLVANLGGEDTVVYWQKKSATQKNPITYVVRNNQANARKFDVVKRIKNAKVKTNSGPGGYTVLVKVPLKEIGLDKVIGQELKGMVGVIYSDPVGKNRAVRLYWHNKHTGLVNDVPSEAGLDIKHWGPVLMAK